LENHGCIEDRGLPFSFDIASEQETDLRVIDVEDQGVVIDNGRTVSVPWIQEGPGWMQGCYRHFGTELNALSPSNSPQGNPLFSDEGLKPIISRGGRGIPGLPDLPHRYVFNHRSQPVQVVRLRMGEDHHIEMPHPAMPEVRKDYPFPNIEAVIDIAAPIYQHSPSARQFQKNSIPLPHIEECYLDPPRLDRK
jgi:hypothetical protein